MFGSRLDMQRLLKQIYDQFLTRMGGAEPQRDVGKFKPLEGVAARAQQLDHSEILRTVFSVPLSSTSAKVAVEMPRNIWKFAIPGAAVFLLLLLMTLLWRWVTNTGRGRN
jgi:hypothetical protein